MNLLNKVKNFFYEDEDETENEEKEEERVSHKEKKVKSKYDEYSSDTENISERELFKSERTFNFPMDLDDENEVSSIKTQEKVKTNTVKEPLYRQKVEYKENPYSGLRAYAKTEAKKEEKEVKKFKPTPVISPIYGILDKNYKKEDIIIDSADDYNSKKVDYDTVRRKAYANVYNKEEDKKDIFYNLDEEENDIIEEKSDDNDDVKIIYNDVTLDEDNDFEEENITIGEKIEKYKQELNQDLDDDDDMDDDSKVLSETKEQDLFNLIDNMYNSDDDDDEEDE